LPFEIAIAFTSKLQKESRNYEAIEGNKEEGNENSSSKQFVDLISKKNEFRFRFRLNEFLRTGIITISPPIWREGDPIKTRVTNICELQFQITSQNPSSNIPLASTRIFPSSLPPSIQLHATHPNPAMSTQTTTDNTKYKVLAHKMRTHAITGSPITAYIE
jgi:hypothetical protein